MKMKRIVSAALAFVIVASLVACKEDNLPKAQLIVGDKEEHKVEGTLHLGFDNVQDVGRVFTENGKTEKLSGFLLPRVRQ